MKFKIEEHSYKGGPIGEIRDDAGELLAVIYPGKDGRSLRILSKHLMGLRVDEESYPPVVEMILGHACTACFLPVPLVEHPTSKKPVFTPHNLPDGNDCVMGYKEPTENPFMEDTCCTCGMPTRGIYVRGNLEDCKRDPKPEDHDWSHACCDACWLMRCTVLKEPPRIPVRVLREKT